MIHDLMFASFIHNNGICNICITNYISNTSYTCILGKLLSLFEAGVPHRLSTDLDTIGTDNLNIASLKSGPPVHLESLYQTNKALHTSLFGRSMTAHPKIDPLLNRLISWTWSAKPAPTPENALNNHVLLQMFEWDDKWNSITPTPDTLTDNAPNTHPHSTEESIPLLSHVLTNTFANPHDFSFTRNHYLLIENRVDGDTVPYLLGTKTPAACIDIVPDAPMILNIIPRKHTGGGSTSSSYSVKEEDVVSSVVYTALTPGFTIHSVGAWENDGVSLGSGLGQATGGGGTGTIELLTTGWDTEVVRSGFVKGGLLGSWEGAAPAFDNIPSTYLYRTIVNRSDGALISHSVVKGMENIVVEHPHIHRAFEGRPLRYIFSSLCSENGVSSPPLGYMRLDLHTGERVTWYAPLHTYCEEVVVVPKVKKDPLEYTLDEQAHVWILATMFDAVRGRSCIGIIDGERLQDGPVCRMWLTHHLPHSLHGCFTDLM